MMQPRGWPAVAAAVALGAVTGFAQQPYDLPFVFLVGFAAAIWLANGDLNIRKTALVGWAFGFGYFLHVMRWIVSPFMVDVEAHGWMAPFALVLLAAGLALFWGAAFGLAKLLYRGAFPWLLAFTLPAMEMLRAYALTGFPWATPSQALVTVAGGQALAILGPHGLNVAVAVSGACIVTSVSGWQRGIRQFWWSASASVVALVLAVLPPPQSHTPLTENTVRLVQPNAAQRDKWDPEKAPTFVARQIEFTAAAPSDVGSAPDLIIWPETAIPYLLEHAEPVITQIMEAAGDAQVSLGLQRRDNLGFYNSMLRMGPGDGPQDLYDKHHLVPFGEYMPFASLWARFNIFGLASRAQSGYLAGPGPRLMDFGKLGQALPLICYEAVFAHDVGWAPKRPDFLIQITNDAWFGAGAGPLQHLAQARMRAIEQGLPLARAANTGVSAMIGPRGHLLATLPLNEAGFVDARLPAPLSPTLYARTGDMPAILAIVFILLWFSLRWARDRHRKAD